MCVIEGIFAGISTFKCFLLWDALYDLPISEFTTQKNP